MTSLIPVIALTAAAMALSHVFHLSVATLSALSKTLNIWKWWLHMATTTVSVTIISHLAVRPTALVDTIVLSSTSR